MKTIRMQIAAGLSLWEILKASTADVTGKFIPSFGAYACPVRRKLYDFLYSGRHDHWNELEFEGWWE